MHSLHRYYDCLSTVHILTSSPALPLLGREPIHNLHR